RIAHPRYATLGANVRWHTLEGHHGHRTGILGDLGMVRGDDIHDHATLEHLRHAALDPRGTGRRTAGDARRIDRTSGGRSTGGRSTGGRSTGGRSTGSRTSGGRITGGGF